MAGVLVMRHVRRMLAGRVHVLGHRSLIGAPFSILLHTMADEPRHGVTSA
jgi:hypothetical protein